MPAKTDHFTEKLAPWVRRGETLVTRVGEWPVVRVERDFPNWVITVRTSTGQMELPVAFHRSVTIRRGVNIPE